MVFLDGRAACAMTLQHCHSNWLDFSALQSLPQRQCILPYALELQLALDAITIASKPEVYIPSVATNLDRLSGSDCYSTLTRMKALFVPPFH